MEDNSTKTKLDNKFDKLKRAAVSSLAAAAVKAKLLANQEEDQIRHLATLLMEKQVISWPGKGYHNQCPCMFCFFEFHQVFYRLAVA